MPRFSRPGQYLQCEFCPVLKIYIFKLAAVHGSGIEVLSMADILQWMVDSRKPFLVYLEVSFTSCLS